MESPCGEGSAAGSTDKGVTDTSITIGYGDDAGFTISPGLNHELSDGIEAVLKWCNDQGGINGRQVKGNYYDAKITEVANAITQACSDEVFMLVGEGWALDSGQEQIRLGCQLPAFPGFQQAPAFANGPLMIAATPFPFDMPAIGHANYYAKTFPEKAERLAFIYADYATTRNIADKSKSTWPNVGLVDLECDQVYNIAGESDWKPFIQKLKDCGAEVVSFVGSPSPYFENVLTAADQLDYHPDWLLDPNFYTPEFAEWNTGGLADHVYVGTGDVPVEAASQNKATQDYLDMVTATGGDTSGIGSHAVSAFLFWATQVKACGSTVTRDCVMDNAKAVHEWDAGGLHGKTDPGANIPTACQVVLTLQGTTWRQVNPANAPALDCDPANVQIVTGPLLDRAKLEDRVSTEFSQ